MSYWPPPPTLPSTDATPSTLSPKHEHVYEHGYEHAQSEQYRSPQPPSAQPQTYSSSSSSSSHPRLYEGSLFPHAEPPLPLPQSHQQHQHQHQPHHGHDTMPFEWQSRQYAAPMDPRMLPVSGNLDPLPIEDSSCSEVQRSSVSLEDEIFEARMLQEALQDCDAMPAAMVHSSSYHDASDDVKLSGPPMDEHYGYHAERHHIHDQHHASPSSALFQPQSFQAQLLHPSAFATPTNAVMPRGALTHRDSGIHVVSPVETLRSYVLTSHSSGQPMLSTSPSSYSSSSSSRSPTMGLARLPGTTPPPGAVGPQAQPKKRVQQARICHVEGCTRGIRSRGLCKAHGGGRRCTTPGCTTSDQGGGHCVLHGGGRRCRIDGCMKSAQWRGVCKLHGGARRCRFGNCTKNGQVKQGYCRLHYNALMQQRQQQQQAELSLQAQGREGELKLEHDRVDVKFSAMDPSQQQQQFS